MYILILNVLTKQFILFIITALTLIYIWFQYKYTYWTKRKVFGPKPVVPFGNFRAVIARKEQFFQPHCNVYFKYKHLPYVGMYCFHRPVLCIIDPDLMKLILIKDFDHFQSHGLYSGGVGDPLARHLFTLHGDEWKNLRLKISPTFSNKKIKSMYKLVENIANNALAYIDLVYSKEEAMNFSYLFQTYMMEIVASVGFGIECNGFKNPNSEFLKYGFEFFNPVSTYLTLIRTIAFILPDLYDKMKIRRMSSEVTSFYYNLVKQTVKYREENNYKRNDFLQSLIELKNNKSMNKIGQNLPQDGKFSMTDIAGNTMLYMLAGYETSSTVGQLAAYELAANPLLQDKARKEIRRVLAKYNGECTFEAQSEMTYLDMVLDESMRKYPPMRSLFRRCTKEYRLPNSDLVIEKGTMVFIPIQAIQMDPEVFPNPEVFDPERFAPENKAKMHPCHWMPFGEGPRKCIGVLSIGLRQGYVQIKLILVKILQKYALALDERTAEPVKPKISSMAFIPEGGVWIKLKKINI